MADLRLSGIKKAYGDHQVIHGIDLDIASREFVVFVGPSGCGKSTLLRMIAGLEDISGGDLWVEGQRANDLPPVERGMSMVFQSYALYPHMTVAENMGFGLKMAKTPKAEIKRRVDEAARILQIEPYLDRKPAALSGGQRQRVAIGRAITRNPKVFLFDEPLSNLDTALRVQMRIEIGRLHREIAATMIYVTHDQVEAMTLADKIVVLRAGRIEQVGRPLELYKNPANKFVAGFLGSPAMNFLPCKIAGMSSNEISVLLPSGDTIVVPRRPNAGIAVGQDVTLGIRPEHLTLGQGEGPMLIGEVQAIERLGGQSYLYVALPDKTWVTIEASAESEAKIGDQVQAGFALRQAHIFDSKEAALAPSELVLA